MTTTTTRTDHRGIDDLLCERITRTLNEQHHGIDWLATETGLSERVLHSRMAGQTTWTLSELGEIAMALGCKRSDDMLERISLPEHPGVRCQRIHGTVDWHVAGDSWQATLTAAGRIQRWPEFPALVNPDDLSALADCMREIRTRWVSTTTA